MAAQDGTVAGEPGGAHQTARRGRATSSPPQFGHTRSISSAHATQKVHSWLQIVACPSGTSAVPQRSQLVLISSATA
jgi:hypothetical protein